MGKVSIYTNSRRYLPWPALPSPSCLHATESVANAHAARTSHAAAHPIDCLRECCDHASRDDWQDRSACWVQYIVPELTRDSKSHMESGGRGWDGVSLSRAAEGETKEARPARLSAAREERRRSRRRVRTTGSSGACTSRTTRTTSGRRRPRLALGRRRSALRSPALPPPANREDVRVLDSTCSL